MARRYDPDVMKDLPPCPLCDSAGSLRPIRFGGQTRRRPLHRAAAFGFALLLNKSYECTRCAAMFSQGDVLAAKHRSDPPARAEF